MYASVVQVGQAYGVLRILRVCGYIGAGEELLEGLSHVFGV